MKHSYLLLVLLAFMSFQVQGQILGENMIENFENVNRLRYGFRDGALDSGIVNPFSGGANTSTKVAKYTRNPGAQYDVLLAKFRGGTVRDVASYLSGAKKFTMKVYTNATVGTPIMLTLENSAASGGGYPIGRHSTYTATVTQSNAWVNLIFDPSGQPAPSTDGNLLDQIVFSFNNNSNTAFEYYFDDLAGPAFGAAPSVPNSEFLWSDFNSFNAMRFKPNAGGGPLTKAANPARSAAHLVDSAAKYVRSNLQYDVLLFSWPSILQDLNAYRSNTKKFSLNVFSPAAGTTVQFTLQDSIAALQGYPTGRFGEFTGITTVSNGWERVTLSWSNTPDGNVTDARVNELAILFNSNTFVPITVYLDSIFGPRFNFTATSKLKAVQNLTVAPNPAQDYFNVSFTQTDAGVATVDVLDMQGRTLVSESVSNTGSAKTHRVATTALMPGIYQCRVTTSTGSSVKKVVVN